jgi:hypothetical protein
MALIGIVAPPLPESVERSGFVQSSGSFAPTDCYVSNGSYARAQGDSMIRNLLIAAVVIATPALAAPRDTPDMQLSKLLAGRAAGKPTNCISLSNTQSSQIIDHTAIVYRSGSRIYVNTPRSGADTLDDDDILVTRTIGSELCRNDSVNLIDRGSRIQHGFVILGPFVPYERPKRPKHP